MHKYTLESLSIMRIEIISKSCYNDIKIRGAENPNNNRRKGKNMEKYNGWEDQEWKSYWGVDGDDEPEEIEEQ